MVTGEAPPRSWAIPTGVAWVSEGEVITVIALETTDADGPLVLSGSAAAIWSVVADRERESYTTDDVIRELVERHGLERQQIADDVARFLEELQGHHLIELREA
ncbi:hypothetical protein ACVLV4_000107 [Rathayibacter agropyri]